MSSRVIGVLCALGVLLCIAPGAAYGQEPGAELAPTMVVLDASGSMTGADPAGGTKMDAAKQAVHTFLGAAPDGAPVGLAAYGTATGNSDAERAQGCQDVTVVSPVGPLDRTGLGAAVDRLTPRGYTPIGRALQVAAEQLPQEGPRSIVLVSDGVDTCAPPEPCEVVRTLAGQGVDLVVHAVGFGVDAAARAQLSCIAQATGGTYTDAPDADALRRVLPRVAGSALRNYQPAGTPITGAATVGAAPVAAPGQHLDTIGQHEQRYYSVDVPEGATAYFSATVSFPRLPGVSITSDFNVLELRTYGEAGEDCHEYENEQATNSSHGEALTVETTWTGAADPETGNATGDRCKGGGRYTFALTWDRVSSGVPERLPVELLVAVEPPVADAGPVAVLPTPAFAEPQGPPRPVVGGGSFNVAGALDGSGRYTDTLQRGEFVFYRVQLDWGQALAYRVRFAETPGRSLRNLSPTSTVVYAPSREEISSDNSSYTGSEMVLPSSKPAMTTVPVRYNNRTADDYPARTQSVAGTYYIAVQLGPAAEDPEAAVPVPIQLDVSVSGDPEPGPRYAQVAAPPGGQAPAGAPNAQAPAVRTVIAPAGWVAIGVGALVVIGLVVAVVARRRRGA
ncbi:vWA domain-containing protein [Pseudonocardia adelaidensis]|uniref:vWA domain-containing protein n=1 Tax=Pseudonocardia adelaidensis TaxID=648754 RepID=UPI0031E66293